MIHIAFEGGLGNQMFQYAHARYLQEKFDEPVEYDISKYTFESTENRNFELQSFNIKNDWQEAPQKKNRVSRFGWKYILYIGITLPYIRLNRLMKKHKNKYIMTEGYQKLINKLGFYRIHFGGYEEPVKSSTKIKYIRGQWIFKDAVIKMGDTIKDELRVITPISDENKATLLYIKKCNSVAVHIRRGDYVDLGLIVCDIEYYKRCMDKMAAMIEDPIFFIFSDDVNWVRENLITNHDMFFVNNNNSAPDDMRLMYSCKHFIMSNSTFSWWGAYLGSAPDKKVIAPEIWAKGGERSKLILDDWMVENNIGRENHNGE